MQCKVCGQDNAIDARFCAKCGTTLETTTEQHSTGNEDSHPLEPQAIPTVSLGFWGKYKWLTIAFAIIIITVVTIITWQVQQAPTLPLTRSVLEFGELAADDEDAKWENELGRWKPATAIINGEERVLTSRYFKTNTQVGRDNLGRIELLFEWDEEGSMLCEQITSRLIGKPLAIFEGNEALLGISGRPLAPVVQSVIKDRGVITGLSLDDATRLSEIFNTK